MLTQNYVIELLEDLHSGDGLGRSDTDNTIARSDDGVPELRWSHLKGVLRANAEALARRGLIEPSVVVDMFGWDAVSEQERPSDGRVVFGTAKAIGPTTSHRRTTTALVPTARVPLTETRRTKEWLPAGSKLSWTCYVPHELMGPWRQVLAATRALGSQRTRGAGRVAIVPAGISASALPVQSGTSRRAITARLRLIVCAHEPLCFPIAGQVGNIVQTEQFIPGSALRGALIHACLTGEWGANAKDWAQSEVADCNLYVGNGYPSGDKHNWLDDTVVPAWSHLRQPKWRARHSDLPAWIPGGAEAHKAESGSRMTGSWFVAWNGGGDPELRRSQTVHHQRIRAHGRESDPKQALFGTTSLASGTRWVTDLLFPDADAARAFSAHVLEPMMTSGVIRLGRGGRPAQVESADWIDEVPTSGFQDGRWSLLLTSDLILRGPNLAYLVDLRSSEALKRLFGHTLHQALDGSGYLSPRNLLGGGGVHTVRGFNASTRMPRPFACAMSKGSVLTFSNLDASLAEAVAAHLNRRRAHGERQHEGFGRVLWIKDLPEQITQTRRLIADPHVKQSAADLVASSAKAEAIARRWAAPGGVSPLTRRQTGQLLELARRESETGYPHALRALLSEFNQLASATLDSRTHLEGTLMRGHQPALSLVELQLLCRWLLVLRGEA